MQDDTEAGIERYQPRYTAAKILSTEFPALFSGNETLDHLKVLNGHQCNKPDVLIAKLLALPDSEREYNNTKKLL